MTEATLHEVLHNCSLSKNWKAFLWRGIVACVLAVLTWLMPAEAVLALTIVFGAFSFADGVFGLWSGYKNMQQSESWGWLIFSGVLGIATGLIVLVTPFVATVVLAVFLWAMIAFWSIATGLMEIVAAIRLRKEIKGEWLLILSGVISVVLGCAVTWFLFTTPAGSVLALGWLLGVYAAIFGVTMILLALKLRKLDVSDDEVGTEASAKQAMKE
ncbi:HdeD family acid-resistance protein [Leisingera aquaemixtae]|uniref:Acid-resistance membrane protein n=1 Tax=Leisingera aquaemixtae TaxID=1396826 RepID=A0A0P1HEF2_9RHOB|nr:HdeD family acid-resistance protein [Leisingera aquaemixtae]CUI01777.1 acid-resistance membrane protein [Leisingera aquaemixtae]